MDIIWRNKSAIPGFSQPVLKKAGTGKLFCAWAQTAYGKKASLDNPNGYQIIICEIKDSVLERKKTIKTNGFPNIQDLHITSGCFYVLWTDCNKNLKIYDYVNDSINDVSVFKGNVLSVKTQPIDQKYFYLTTVTQNKGKPILNVYHARQINDVAAYKDTGIKEVGVWNFKMLVDNKKKLHLVCDQWNGSNFTIKYLVHDRTTIQKTIMLPTSGYATTPDLCINCNEKIHIVWRQDKPWSRDVYDFTRDCRLKVAQIFGGQIINTEIVPIDCEYEYIKPQLPMSPVIHNNHNGEIDIFYRMYRFSMKDKRGLPNDWGWNLYGIHKDSNGQWYTPEKISYDPGYPDSKIVLELTDKDKVTGLYASCSYDDLRKKPHSHRINIISFKDNTPKNKNKTQIVEKKYKDITPKNLKRQKINIEDSTLSCYFGDIHRHSNISKCIPEYDGTVKEHAAYSISARDFDFYALADHSYQISDHEWENMMDTADSVTNDGNFAWLYGYEHNYQGHSNIYFKDREAAKFGMKVILKCKNMREVYRQALNYGMEDKIMIVRHFHADGLPYKFLTDKTNPNSFIPSLEFAMEAVQTRGYSPNAMHTLLGKGLKFGFIGSSDHCRPPGHPNGGVGIYEQAVTGIWSPNISRQDIFNTFRKKRTFCTNGPKMSAYIKVNNKFMGSTIKKCEQYNIEVFCNPTTTLKDIRLISGGVKILKINGNRLTSNGCKVTIRDDLLKGVYIYAQIIQEPENNNEYDGIAWTTPVWIDT